MTEFTISIAGIRVGIAALFASTRQYCRNYLTEASPDFSVAVTQADIAFEQQKSDREYALEGLAVQQFSAQYLETLAVYRKIASEMLNYDTFLFHGSVIAVDGEGYLFTATSGTGKSTHTRLWREVFGDRAVMVNDDKPLLRVTENGVFACGTPWDGKHHLSTNTMVPLKGICILTRGLENEIQRIPPVKALSMMLQQSHRPQKVGEVAKLMELIDGMLAKVPVYVLKCNMDPEAALVSYQGMSGKQK